MDGVDCFRCKYFCITHRPETPYSCQLFQFRSKEIPSLLVKRETDEDCLGFKAKHKGHKLPEHENEES